MIRKGLCNAFEQAKCANEFGDFLEVTCAKCAKLRAQDLNIYTGKMLRIRNLQMAGYPFDKNDLSPEEWEDLGRLNETLR